MKQMTIGKKLTWTSGGLIAGTLLVGGVAVWGLGRVNQITNDIVTNRLPGIIRMGEIEASINRISGNTWHHIATQEAAAMAKLDGDIGKLKAEVEKAAGEYEKAITAAEDRALWAKFRPAWQRYSEAIQGPLALSRAGKRDQAANKYNVEVQPFSNALRETVGALVALNQRNSEEPAKAAAQVCRTALWIIWVTVALGAAGGIGAAGVQNRNIGRILGSLQAEFNRLTEAVAAGRFGARGDVDKINFEFRPLLEGANRILDSVVGHFDNIPLPVLTVDRDFTLQYMNQTGAELVGRRKEQLVGTKCYDNLRTTDCQTGKCAVGRAMQEGHKADGRTCARPNGREMEITYTGTPIRDERGTVVGALEVATDQTVLVRVIHEVTDAVAAVASSSTELSSVATQMANGAKQTSDKAQSVAAAAEELSSNVSSVSASMELTTNNLCGVANATEQMTATVGEIAGKSEKARLVTGEAARQAEAVSARMSALGEAAQQIGKVTETISDISAQTNLLALNATIEAARAGAAGKGFAVVANEIKDLAQQTAAATEDIKTKIGGIQSSTAGAIADIGKITLVTREVTEIVAAIAAAIEEQSAATRGIAKNIGQASSAVADTHMRVAQSSAASGEIARDISGVNQAAGEIASASQQVYTSSTQLSKLAEQLKGLVDQLKV